MDIRYSCNQRDFKRYTTEEIRKEFLIEKLFEADHVIPVYSHVDRMVTVGVMPVCEKVPLDKGIDIWHSFGTRFFLERREMGMFNVGGEGTVTVDGTAYELGYKDCLYITMGERSVFRKQRRGQSRQILYRIRARAYQLRNQTDQDCRRGQEAVGSAGNQQQARDQPVHSSRCSENLPAFNGYDSA